MSCTTNTTNIYAEQNRVLEKPNYIHESRDQDRNGGERKGDRQVASVRQRRWEAGDHAESTHPLLLHAWRHVDDRLQRHIVRVLRGLGLQGVKGDARKWRMRWRRLDIRSGFGCCQHSASNECVRWRLPTSSSGRVHAAPRHSMRIRDDIRRPSLGSLAGPGDWRTAESWRNVGVRDWLLCRVREEDMPRVDGG